jgi:DNA-directed RNA polymerase II subunit RPB1
MSSFIKPSSKRNLSKTKEENNTKPSIRRKSPIRTKKTTVVKKFKRKPQQNVQFEEKEVSFEPFIQEVVEHEDDESDIEDYCEKGTIDNIQFSFMSEKEVADFAVVKITETKLGGPNSLYDTKMGPSSKGEVCETCECNWEDCPGHFGYIELNSKFPHPLRSKNIVEYLSIFCKDCQHLVITKECINMLGFDKQKGETRFKHIHNHIEKNVTVCSWCENILPVYTFFDDKYMMEIKDKKYPVQYETIYKIFSNIRECDIELLGFNSKYVHPIKLMLGNLLVVPPCVRPFIKSDDGESCHDDLTYKYIDILKKNNKLREVNNEKARLDVIDELMFHIKTLMDNSKGKSREISGKRPIKCIKQRISSKQGRIRQNIQGKRVNFSGRTVIGCDANCMVDELIIPPDVAMKLTYPVKVTSLNFNMCNKLLEEGKVNIIIQNGVQKNAKYAMWTEGFKFKDTDIIIRGGKRITAFELAEAKFGGDINKLTPLADDVVIRDGEKIKNLPIKRRKEFNLNIGDTIERQLQDGDLVVFNRQPTLWKGSMRAKRVKILPGKTFRFNLSSTQAFNADFDGDEMNLWLAESEKSRAECATILNTVDNFMSSQDSKPLLALKQDAMTGGFVLTDGVVPIPKHTFFECITNHHIDLDYIYHKFNHIKSVYDKLGKTAEIKEKILNNKTSSLKNTIEDNSNKLKTLKDEHDSIKGDQKQVKRKNEIATLYKEIKANNEKLREQLKELSVVSEEELDNEILYNGHSYFSMILPDDFEYFADNKASRDGKPVLVKRGVLLSGTLDKMAIGSSSGSLIHHIAKDYGYERASKFVGLYQILINKWLTHYGYSIGLEDCIPKDTELIESEMNKCFLKATAAIRTEKDEELLEAKINGFLGEAITIGQKIAKDALKQDNNMVRVIRSGAKGNFFNITQVTGVVGQQNVVGSRIQKTYGGRTLPHYIDYSNNIINEIEEKNQDPLPILKDMFESRGFVRHSYFQGLTPQEYFFHASGGREGLLDTALKTASTGYLQRKMIKMVEDLKFDYTNVVSNAKNNIIEFMYGEDNMDASKLIKTKEGLSFIDINHINEKLNAEIEFN